MRAQVIEPSSTRSGEKRDGGGEARLVSAGPYQPYVKSYGGVALIKGCCQKQKKQVESRFAFHADDPLLYEMVCHCLFVCFQRE